MAMLLLPNPDGENDLRVLDLATASAPFQQGEFVVQQVGRDHQPAPFRSGAAHVLIVRPYLRLRVNGLPLCAGIRRLRHMDEICADNGEVIGYFLAYSPPRVVEFNEAQHGHLSCPICTRPLSGPCVECPRCSVWFHETEAYPCWSGGETCPTAGCPQKTRLDGEPDSIPENWQPRARRNGGNDARRAL